MDKRSFFSFFKKWQKVFLFLGVFIFVWPWYMVINQLHQLWGTKGISLEIWIDKKFFFSSYWQVIYCTVYVFILSPILFIKDNQYYRRMIYSFLLTYGIAFFIFLIYPVQMIRPNPVPSHFFLWVTRLIQFLDPPYNCFPSLHVANAIFVGLAIFAVDRKMGIYHLFWGILIGISTLFCKQHFFLDVVSGAILAFLSYFIFMFPLRKKQVPEKSLTRSRLVLLIPILIYFFIILGAFVLYKSGFQPFS